MNSPATGSQVDPPDQKEKSAVEFELPGGYTMGDWALVLQCLDEDGDDRLVLRFSESISGTLQYGLLGQGFDAVRADQTGRWESQ